MYKFVDTAESQETSKILSSVAMNFNGEFLERLIPWYRTLNVGGRELIGVNVETAEDISGRDGDYILGQTLPSRTLTIEYKLETKNNSEFRYAFNKMNEILHTKEDVPILFIDEPDYTFYGRFNGFDDIPYNTNIITSNFTILCQDPYKYAQQKLITGNPIALGYICPYGIVPDEIKVTIGQNTDKITIDNNTTGRHIVLDGEFTAGQELIIDIKNNKITLNGQNRMNYLDYVKSDFHNFLVHDRDTIQVNPDSKMALKIRGRLL